MRHWKWKWRIQELPVEVAHTRKCGACKNSHWKWRIQELPVDTLKQINAAAKRSGNLNSKLGETTALGNDTQFMVFL